MTTWFVLMCASAALGSSSLDEQRALRRLVGDGTLSPAQVGPSEEIVILLSHWTGAIERNLWFVLGADRVLTVARYRTTSEIIRPSVEGRSTGLERADRVRLSPAAFAEMRSRLALFRPETLAPTGTSVLPAGCHYIFDAGEEVTISFVGPDDRFGQFSRQGERECNSGSAHRLDEVLSEILASFPRTEAARGFIWQSGE